MSETPEEKCRHLQVVGVMTGPDPDKDAAWVCTKPQCRQRFVPRMETTEAVALLRTMVEEALDVLDANQAALTEAEHE